jgi:ornithine decarboxylase
MLKAYIPAATDSESFHEFEDKHSPSRLGNKNRKIRELQDENRALKEQLQRMMASLSTQESATSDDQEDLAGTDASLLDRKRRMQKKTPLRGRRDLRRRPVTRVPFDLAVGDAETAVNGGAADIIDAAAAADDESLRRHASRRQPLVLQVNDGVAAGVVSILSEPPAAAAAACPEEDEVARLKLRVWEELQKGRDEYAPPIELHSAPRSIPDHLLELIPKHRTAFNFVDLGVVVDKYLLWKRKLPRAEPFYAIKSNPDPEIANTLFVLGAGFDCASRGEIKQVLEMGCPPEKIIFANPCKHPDHLTYAKDHGVEMMTFDNMQELDKIQTYYPEAKLVLRILPDDSFSLMPFGIKFGATFEDAVKLVERCKEMQMNLIGVSFHVGSGCFSSVGWVEALKLARRVFDEAARLGFDLDFLDLGGGWPGHENGALKFANIGDDISPIIDQLFPAHVRVIGEPGRFFCAECTSLAVTVVSKRERIIAGAVGQEPEREMQYYINDGVYGSFNCIMFDHAHPEPAFLVSNVNDRPLQQACIFGPTCDSMDCVVKKIMLPEHHVGEWMYFPYNGSYTGAAASEFNGFPKPKNHYVLRVSSTN